LPIHREVAANKRWSESAKLEYQNVPLSEATCGETPPGLRNRARTIRATMMKIPTSVAGSAMLELEASLADTSGPEADCELLAPDPFAGVVVGDAVLRELGTSGVTLVGTLVLGATAFCVLVTAALVVSPADFEVEL